jgi:cell division protein FtsL
VNDSHDNLLLIILADLRQHFYLGVLILITALYSIYVTHETRELVTKKESLSQQKDNLMIEWRNLLIEEHTLDEHSRIRNVADKQLSMAQPTKNNSVLVEIR